jgi:hypothetical protein
VAGDAGGSPGCLARGQVISEGGFMSTVTMQELELETAELLPGRETLTTYSHPSSFNAFNQINASANGNGNGNVHQFGLLNVAAGNGNLNGNLSGNNVQIL